MWGHVPHINWSLVTPTVSLLVNSMLCTVVNDNFLTQLVSSPTRGDHIPDLVFQTILALCMMLELLIDNLPGCDHDAVEFNLSATLDNVVQSNRILFNYSKADLHEFQEVLSHVPWNCILTDNGIKYAGKIYFSLQLLLLFLLSNGNSLK